MCLGTYVIGCVSFVFQFVLSVKFISYRSRWISQWKPIYQGKSFYLLGYPSDDNHDGVFFGRCFFDLRQRHIHGKFAGLPSPTSVSAGDSYQMPRCSRAISGNYKGAITSMFPITHRKSYVMITMITMILTSSAAAPVSSLPPRYICVHFRFPTRSSPSARKT